MLRCFALLSLVAVPAGAVTQTDTVSEGADLQRFQPDPTPLGGFGAGSGDTLLLGEYGVGLHLNYARNPLIVVVNGERVAHSIQNNLTGHVHGSVGLHEVLELALSLPVVVYQDGDDPRTPTLSGSVVGDLRLQPRLRILSQWKHGVSLMVSPVFTIPLGGNALLAGEPGIGFIPEVAATRHWGLTYLTGALSMRVRSARTVLPSTVLGNEINVRVAGGMPFSQDLDGILELNAAAALATISAGFTGNPLEMLAGIRRRFGDAWAVDAALGIGILSAPGTPDLRVLAGLTYGKGLAPKPDNACTRTEGTVTEERRALGRDSDGDGIDDACDVCAAEGESVNGIDDLDGCPEPDTDKDGLIDVRDECPLKAGAAPTGCPDTDGDGVLDRSDECVSVPGEKPTGCPDLDGDGLLDRDDRCPAQPGAAPSGCPDTDSDGLLDPDDKCPEMPEDKDGFEDADGCPDPDNDKDGVLDAADKCPAEPETINGVEDDDGCPDKGKSLVVLKKEKIEILDKVFFATNKDIIEERSFGLLKQVALILVAHAEIEHVRVEGHTDDVGGRVKNIDLSQRRADSVVRFLVKEGVAQGRLIGQGFAFDRPLVPNTNEKNRATNRRVEFVIVNDEPPAEAAPATPATPAPAPGATP